MTTQRKRITHLKSPMERPIGGAGAERRRARQAGRRQPEGAEATPERIRARAAEVGAASTRMAVPDLGEERQEVLAQTDPRVLPLSTVLMTLLGGSPELERDTAVSARHLSELMEQRTELYKTQLTAAHLMESAMDARRVQGGKVRRLLRRLAGHLRDQLQPGVLPPAEQARLRSDSSELLWLVDRMEEARRLRTNETRRLARVQGEELIAARRKARAERAARGAERGLQAERGEASRSDEGR